MNTQVATNPIKPLIAMPKAHIGTVFMTKKTGARQAERHTLAEIQDGKIKSTTPADKYGAHTFVAWWTYGEFQKATNGLELADAEMQLLQAQLAAQAAEPPLSPF